MRFNCYPLLILTVILGFTITDAQAQDKITADDMPQQWQYTEGFVQTIPTQDKWWLEFNDTMLDSLISLGIENNYDILAAQRRIEMARQTLRQTQAAYYPTLGLNAGWTAQRTSGVTTATSMDASKINYFDLGVNMNWQIDVFGKITARAKQSKAAFNATRMEYDAMMVTISAKIASAYIQLRMLQGELTVLQEHIAQQKRVVDITQARHEAGLASMLDVTQALTNYYSTVASVTSINSSIATTINGLAVLIGVYPEQLRPYLSQVAPLPNYHQLVSVGIPMDLLRRRPDIAEAEYTLAGYAAALGIAKKDFLPTLSLSGSIGTMAHKRADLFTDRSFTYSIAPTLSWTIFDGMSRKAALNSAKEQMQMGIYNYNNTVISAVQEVDNAMSTYYNSLQYIDMISKVVEQSEKSFKLSIDLYKQGLTDFINVSNTQIAYLQYSNELVAAKGQALASLVNLYEALGGGWNE